MQIRLPEMENNGFDNSFYKPIIAYNSKILKFIVENMLKILKFIFNNMLKILKTKKVLYAKRADARADERRMLNKTSFIYRQVHFTYGSGELARLIWVVG